MLRSTPSRRREKFRAKKISQAHGLHASAMVHADHGKSDEALRLLGRAEFHIRTATPSAASSGVSNDFDSLLPDQKVALSKTYFLRGRVFLLFNPSEPALALRNFTMSLSLLPNFEAHVGRGRVYADLIGDPHKALEEYNIALDLHDGSDKDGLASALAYRAATLDQLGKVKGALQSYEAALRLDPSFVIARFNRAELLLSLGRRKQALEDFTRVVELASSSSSSSPEQEQEGRGKKKKKKSKPKSSTKQLLVAALLRRGKLLHDLSYLTEANSDFEKIIELVSSSSSSYRGKRGKRGKRDKRQQYFRTHVNALLSRAAIQRKLKKYDIAIGDCGRALEVAKKFARDMLYHVYCHRVTALLCVGRLEEAKRDLMQAAFRCPKNVSKATLYWKLAFCLSMVAHASAKKYLAKAYAADPSFPGLYEALVEQEIPDLFGGFEWVVTDIRSASADGTHWTGDVDGLLVALTTVVDDAKAAISSARRKKWALFGLVGAVALGATVGLGRWVYKKLTQK